MDATPTNGASMSASVIPIARIIDRCGALITPSVVSQDRHLPGALRFLSPRLLLDVVLGDEVVMLLLLSIGCYRCCLCRLVHCLFMVSFHY